MTGPVGDGAPRPERVLETAEGMFRAVEAWRATSGHGLCYFLPLGPEDSAVVPDDRRDRRAALAPEEELDLLTAAELTERFAEAVPLTVTERRFRAPDGRLWLGQSEGPVWADEGTAEGAVGTLFTSLEGTPRRGRGGGGHVGRMSEEELRDAWMDAFDAGDGGGGE